jgi:hypothetical protein
MKAFLKPLLAGALLASLAVPVMAQQAGTPTRLRGTIDSVDGNVLSLTTREGEKIKVNMADNVAVLTTAALSLDDIKDNSYVGVAAMEGEGGQLNALEVFVMPEANRGAGEGHRAWDLQPESTMTNATVDEVAEHDGGRLVKVKYPDGEKEILVTPETPIVTFNPGTVADLQPGLYVFIAGSKLDDGSYTTASVRVEKDGVKPPM